MNWNDQTQFCHLDTSHLHHSRFHSCHQLLSIPIILQLLTLFCAFTNWIIWLYAIIGKFVAFSDPHIYSGSVVNNNRHQETGTSRSIYCSTIVQLTMEVFKIYYKSHVFLSKLLLVNLKICFTLCEHIFNVWVFPWVPRIQNKYENLKSDGKKTTDTLKCGFRPSFYIFFQV
jgi:hypothetical protein